MHALADDDALADWPFISYDPLDYEPMRVRPDASPFPSYNPLTEPLPQPEPARPSLIRRAARFAEKHVDSALIFLLCVDAVLAATRGVA